MDWNINQAKLVFFSFLIQKEKNHTHWFHKKQNNKQKTETQHVEESIFMVTDEIDILTETAFDQKLGNYPGFCN